MTKAPPLQPGHIRQRRRRRGDIAAGGMDAMATTDADGNKRLSVPLSMQDGRLYAGPLLLGDLPPILGEGASF